MNLVKCEEGHYYDGDRHTKCPHCNADSEVEVIYVNGYFSDSIMGVIASPDDEAEDDFISVDPSLRHKIVLHSKKYGEIVLCEGKRNVLGRDKKCDGCFNDTLISRCHAFVFFEKDFWYIKDEYSKNHTWLNSKLLDPSKTYKLHKLDKINLANREELIVVNLL